MQPSGAQSFQFSLIDSRVFHNFLYPVMYTSFQFSLIDSRQPSGTSGEAGRELSILSHGFLPRSIAYDGYLYKFLSILSHGFYKMQLIAKEFNDCYCFQFSLIDSLALCRHCLVP